jgi:hypothetical protein
MEEDDKKLKEAKKIAHGKIEFLRHFIVYIAVMVLLAIINNLTYSGYQWWLWPALFWGIGVFINFLVAFVFKGGGLKNLEKNLVEKEIEKMKDEE